MRTSQAGSLVSRIIPSGYMTLSGILLLALVFICFSVRCKHARGIKKISLYGILMLVFGVLIMCVAGAAIRDAERYTHGSERATATITKVIKEYDSSMESYDYRYELAFEYENQVVSVRMYPTHHVGLDQGDTLSVYFYPEQIGHTDYPAVVAVDFEKKQAEDNVKMGFLSCLIGLVLVFFASSKQSLLQNGIHVSATVMQVTITSSKRNTNTDSSKIEKLLVCQGKNPMTGRLQTFKTHGSGLDFLAYTDGDIVHVFVHKKNRKFYVINI